jgi:hypothetical protein
MDAHRVLLFGTGCGCASFELKAQTKGGALKFSAPPDFVETKPAALAAAQAPATLDLTAEQCPGRGAENGPGGP